MPLKVGGLIEPMLPEAHFSKAVKWEKVRLFFFWIKWASFFLMDRLLDYRHKGQGKQGWILKDGK